MTNAIQSTAIDESKGLTTLSANTMKKDQVLYWTTTAIVCSVMVFSAINFNLKHHRTVSGWVQSRSSRCRSQADTNVGRGRVDDELDRAAPQLSGNASDPANSIAWELSCPVRTSPRSWPARPANSVACLLRPS